MEPEPNVIAPPEITVAVCQHGLPLIEDALYVIKSKWSLLILMALMPGPTRFNQLQRKMPGISARVLSHELKHLEINGLIERLVLTGAPVASVEYQLTAYSSTLQEALGALSAWGRQHRLQGRQ